MAQQNGISLAADDGPTLNAGLVFQRLWTSIAKKTLYFCDFSGGSGPPFPPLDPPMGTIANSEETQVKYGILLQYAAFHQGLHSLKNQKGTRNHVFETLCAPHGWCSLLKQWL